MIQINLLILYTRLLGNGILPKLVPPPLLLAQIQHIRHKILRNIIIDLLRSTRVENVNEIGITRKHEHIQQFLIREWIREEIIEFHDGHFASGDTSHLDLMGHLGEGELIHALFVIVVHYGTPAGEAVGGCVAVHYEEAGTGEVVHM